MAAELAGIEAGRAPTATAVFGETGIVVFAVAQSLLISGIGLLFLGAAGALARAARDARAGNAPMHPAAPARAQVAVEQSQGTPAGIPAALPSWGRYALPASFLAAGAGLGACGAATAAGSDAPPMHHAAPTAAPATAAPMHQTDDQDRFERVREGIEAGRIKPSLRGIHAAAGASQEVAKRYLLALEQAGIIERAGRAYRLASNTGRAAA